MELIKNFFKSKTPAYYITLILAICCLVGAIVYKQTFVGENEMFYQSIVMILGILAFVAGITLSQFRITSRFAPGVMIALEFAAVLKFVDASAYYFGKVFLHGINAEAFKLLDSGVIVLIAFDLIALIGGVVMCYFKLFKDKQIEAKEETK